MSKRTGLVVSRRDTLKAAAALAATGTFPFAAKGQTPGKKIVLSTWGGDYAKLLTKHISAPAMAPKGWDVVNDEAQVVQRKAKTLAEKRLPTGTSDAPGLDAPDGSDGILAGRVPTSLRRSVGCTRVVLRLALKRLPRLAQLAAHLADPGRAQAKLLGGHRRFLARGQQLGNPPLLAR